MTTEHELSYLNDDERLKAYQTITNGCAHLWSKGKLQEEKLDSVLENFINLAEKDPIFLAHFTSYAMKKLKSKDLKVVSTFANSLSDADGTPFSPGSDVKKPNLRVVSQAAVQHSSFEPKLLLRLIKIANRKIKLGSRERGTHFSRSLKTAIKKYIKFREETPGALESLKKNAYTKIVKNIYRYMRIPPSNEVIDVFDWAQKKDGRKPSKKKEPLFKGLDELQIAEKIRAEKIPVLTAMGALEKKITPVIACAVLEQATGDQAIILRETFDGQGLLKDKEVLKVFEEKIKTAKTALDRVERIKTEVDESVTNVLKKAKAEKRKEDVGDIGKIFLHIDKSTSMQNAVDLAMDSAATIAECVQNPKENFYWGLFDDRGYVLEKPDKFEKDHFKAKLYGVRESGSTDCVALYKRARELGCGIDVYITDEEHNQGTIKSRIDECVEAGYPKPKASLIVNVRGNGNSYLTETLSKELERNGIPVSVVSPSVLKESALVTQAIKTAMMGANAVLDEIMNEPLLELPKWWFSVNTNGKKQIKE